MVSNVYNELGELVARNLHSDAAGFRQQVDYRYNIRGWLERINHSDADVTTDGGLRDLFGMELNYNTPTVQGGPAQFNGNISQILWSTAGGDRQSYGYRYDPMNRLLVGWSRNHTNPEEHDRYNESVGQESTGLPSYDLNGNILNVLRNGKKATVSQGNIDRLTYKYIGNQLHVVNDAVADSTKETGFKELTEKTFLAGDTSTYEYTYDANGNMISDDNKDIDSIVYNHLNLPARVVKGTGEYLVYTYDATGRKLTQAVFNSSGLMQKETDYAGAFIYENDTLQFINHAEGRVVMTGTTPEYQYHLKDHLGNVRLTFTTKEQTDTASATLETASLPEEQGEFLRLEHARRVQATLFDHTHGSSTGYSQRLNGTENEIYGLARSISVMPGDTLRTEVYVKYVDEESANWNQALNDLMSAIANNTGGIVTDGGSYPASTSSFPYGGLVNTNSSSASAPKAFLNWIIFDRDGNFFDGGFRQVSEAAKENGSDGAHERLYYDSIFIHKPGYVYIYLSNENGTPVEVFFDDFRVEHVKSSVVQMEDYYPFGFAFNSYSRENSTPNQFLYNGMELQDELDLGWYDYIARYYDPTIARWMVVDPAADLMRRHSPYNYAFDNPIRFIDPDGMVPEETDPEKKKQEKPNQEEKPKQEQEDPNGLEAAFIAFIMGLEKLGEFDGDESDDSDDNIRQGGLLLNDLLMGYFGAYMAPNEASGQMSSDDVADDIANKTDDGVNLVVKGKKTWSPTQNAQAAAKADALTNDPTTVVTKNPVTRDSNLRSKFIKQGGQLAPGQHVDHIKELQLGGTNAMNNLQGLDGSVNMSFGSQIQNQIKVLPDATKVNTVRFIRYK